MNKCRTATDGKPAVGWYCIGGPNGVAIAVSTAPRWWQRILIALMYQHSYVPMTIDELMNPEWPRN